MTPLIKQLAKCNWCQTERGFTTVKNGYGFVVYRHRHRMWLAGLSKETVLEQRNWHSDIAPYITGFWVRHRGTYTKRIFEMPATPKLISAIILSACPELSQ